MERERCHGQTATVIREASATDLCMAGDFSCTEMGPGEVTGQDGQEERRVTACFLDIPAPGLRVRLLGEGPSRLPVGNVSKLSGTGRTSLQSFITTNTVSS